MRISFKFMPYILSALMATTLLVACGDDDDSNDDADGGTPAAPTLGTQIDRVGRAAVNTALNNTFNGDSAAAATAKDAYNADKDVSGWSSYADEIAANLAILDSLDTTCGNQLLAGDTEAADQYATLAGALADDQLYVDSSSGTCGQYLAVEANATEVVPNEDCGGRAPSYDVIDTTYSVLAIGALTGVGDGVSSDDGNHSDTAFPFLAAPQ